MSQTSSIPSSSSAHGRPLGVEIIGTGRYVPEKVLSNADLEKMMDTSDEWIVQRTGIKTRHVIDRDKGESTYTMAVGALKDAMVDARIAPEELDLVLLATMTPEMGCPPSSSRVVDGAGAKNAGGIDISGACCGFVYSMNLADALVRTGQYRTVAVVGSDMLTTLMSYTTKWRSTAIIFGDAAGAAIVRACDNPGKGVIAQAMCCDGSGWKEIFVPRHPTDYPPGVEDDGESYDVVHMNGSSVFKFAVGTFPKLIEQTLDKAGLKADDVDMYMCHQSNARILHAARERFGLSEDKMYINIDRYGNTTAATIPLGLDELREAGRVKPGMKIMFVGFGGGLTWGSSLWQL